MGNYTAARLREIFQNKFDYATWLDISKNLFGAKALRNGKPERLLLSTKTEEGFYMGELGGNTTYKIGFFIFNVKNGSVVHKKVGLRNLVRTFINSTSGLFDAAICVFDDEINWRVSFISDIKGDSTNPKRYSFVFGDDSQLYKTAISRFLKLQETGVSYSSLMDAFSVEALTREFFNDLFKWYQWALSDQINATFPNDTSITSDDRQIDTHVIRLITRLIFVWFIKQKKFVPEDLFDVDKLNELLVDFDPYSTVVGNYYNGILQNLFFATLNNEIDKRKFASDSMSHAEDEDYGIKILFRNPEHKSWFKISNEKIIKLFNDIPFLNGGLFECLDKDKPNSNGKIIYSDGFSRKAGKQKRAFLPNVLFFEKEKGILSILKRYNFTIEENSQNDADIALDPELLGKVFENLLGTYNLETRDPARNQSGSFYTPREIVDYMVNESLISFINEKLKELKINIGKDSIKLLFTGEELPLEFNGAKEKCRIVSEILLSIKILDPACGSGAFPMGILNKMLDVLRKLNYRKESILDLKLKIIEDCIYGVDIQPIAVQISKLRFFISIVCEQEIDISKPNFGIIPLPNLETKFVAADTLIGVKKRDIQLNFFDNHEKIDSVKEHLLNIRQRHFRASSRSIKTECRIIDKQLSGELASLLVGNNERSVDDARQLATWDPYDQNTSSPFFDSEWMFDISDGFDVVIGNPPYIQLEKSGGKLALKYKNCDYQTYERTGDIYCLFYERGWQLLKQNAHLCYITSNKWMRAGYGEATRKFFVEKTNPLQLIDFAGIKIFESATVDTNILLFQKSYNEERTRACIAKDTRCRDNLSNYIHTASSIYRFKSKESWVILSPVELTIKNKMESTGIPLKQWDINIYRGVLTGCNEAFIISGDERTAILKNCKDIQEREKTSAVLRPILRGRDIHMYGYKFDDKWLINTHNGIKGKIKRIDIEEFPAIKAHLNKYLDKIKARDDQGDTPYNLRNCAYLEDFSRPKICWASVGDTCYSLIPKDIYLLDTNYFFAVKEPYYLLAVLNSKLITWWINTEDTPIGGGGAFRHYKYNIEKLSIPKCPPHLFNEIKELVLNKSERSIIRIDEIVFDLYGLNKLERDYIINQ